MPLIPMVSRLAPFQHAFVQRLSELGIAYRGSPIVDGSGTRWFDESLRGGNGIMRRFVLFCDEAAEERTKDALRQFVASANDVLELRLGRHPGTMLVRPDGYVAYASPATDGSTLSAARELLERQLVIGTLA